MYYSCYHGATLPLLYDNHQINSSEATAVSDCKHLMYHTRKQTQDRWEGSVGYSAKPAKVGGCCCKELPPYLSLTDCYVVAMER